MGRPFTGTNIERFWRSTRAHGACIIRTTWADKDGYTRFSPRDAEGRYKTTIAHRWIYAQAFGSVPVDKVIMHSCDTPRCVALQHLTVGTQLQNHRDCLIKGRHSAQLGEKSRAAKLTRAQVDLIRQQNTDTLAVVANRFGVSITTIWAIRRGKTWR